MMNNSPAQTPSVQFGLHSERVPFLIPRIRRWMNSKHFFQATNVFQIPLKLHGDSRRTRKSEASISGATCGSESHPSAPTASVSASASSALTGCASAAGGMTSASPASASRRPGSCKTLNSCLPAKAPARALRAGGLAKAGILEPPRKFFKGLSTGWITLFLFI